MPERFKNKEMDSQNIEIGKRIDFIRTTKKWSKEELARLLKITGQHLGNAIKGEVGLSTRKIINLSKISGFSTDFILLGNTKCIDEEMKNLIDIAYNALNKATALSN
ncbi:MAG: helix-turn-helix domain-containing protein [Oscillospiraceae bacterium]|nr:helix-turn-helix domain-containing protein [Oscillospiraceae bacterium]